jgi:hypothetical protein
VPAVTVTDAVPLGESVRVPRELPSSYTVTEPCGFATSFDETETVYVSDCPDGTGFAELETPMPTARVKSTRVPVAVAAARRASPA